MRQRTEDGVHPIAAEEREEDQRRHQRRKGESLSQDEDAGHEELEDEQPAGYPSERKRPGLSSALVAAICVRKLRR